MGMGWRRMLVGLSWRERESSVLREVGISVTYRHGSVALNSHCTRFRGWYFIDGLFEGRKVSIMFLEGQVDSVGMLSAADIAAETVRRVPPREDRSAIVGRLSACARL
jgi:hypothetical protein